MIEETNNIHNENENTISLNQDETDEEKNLIIEKQEIECGKIIKEEIYEAGNCENNFQTHNFNILIIGQAGVGKSAFINQFFSRSYICINFQIIYFSSSFYN